jgi:uncharacterized protein YecE (DUF72 family)
MTSSPKNPSPAGRIVIGPAGWSYPDWGGIVYPTPRPRDFHEATYLAQFFDAIEINTSFYQPLRPGVAAQWLERVAANPNFVFSAKLWKKFTHEADVTAEDERAVREGFAPLSEAHRLAAVLLQFSHSFHRTPENIARLNDLISRFGDYPLVVEVRHSSWNDAEFYAGMEERGVGFCNIDQPVIGRAIRPSERATAAVGYVRLHGRRYDTWFSDDPMLPRHERYNYLYTEKELAPWAARIRKLARGTQTTFVIANNHFQGKSVVNALQLIHMLTGAKVHVPEPLRHHYPQLESIADAPAEEPTLFPLAPR